MKSQAKVKNLLGFGSGKNGFFLHGTWSDGHKGELILLELIMILGVLSQAAIRVQAQSPTPYPRISEEAFQGRLPFFDYPVGVPLAAHVVQEWDLGESRRQKIVFRGAQGRLVPGYFELPKGRAGALPVVLLGGLKKMEFHP